MNTQKESTRGHAGVCAIFTALLVVLGAFIAAPAEAEGAPRAATPAQTLVNARILGHAADGREPFTVGVEFRVAPGWHIYWKNPGDAGLGPRLRWRLPAGYTAGEPRWPVPVKIAKAGLVDFGYRGTATLLVSITPPRDSRAVERPDIILDADWLVCKEECRPGRQTVRFRPGAQPANVRQDARRRLVAAERALPRAMADGGLRVERAEWRSDAGGPVIVVRLAGDGAAAVRDFYPEAIPGWEIRYAEITVARGEIRLPLRASSAPPPTAVRGLAITAGGGYNLTSSLR